MTLARGDRVRVRAGADTPLDLTGLVGTVDRTDYTSAGPLYPVVVRFVGGDYECFRVSDLDLMPPPGLPLDDRRPGRLEPEPSRAEAEAQR